jgi:hypothetical protein
MVAERRLRPALPHGNLEEITLSSHMRSLIGMIQHYSTIDYIIRESTLMPRDSFEHHRHQRARLDIRMSITGFGH